MRKSIKKAKVGILPFDEFRRRTLAVARGEYKPKRGEPKIWFNSMKSLAHVLSEENQALLKLIIDEEPQSVSELEPLTGRKANNLLRTLRTMENYGFVRLVPRKSRARGRTPLIPKVLYDMADVEINFGKLH